MFDKNVQNNKNNQLMSINNDKNKNKNNVKVCLLSGAKMQCVIKVF